MNHALASGPWVTGLAAGPPGTASVNLLAPSTILESLLSILALAWLAARLLGVRQRSWLSVLVCGFTGWPAGGTLALVMSPGKTLTPEAARSAVVFTIVFTMAATAGWELLARPGRRPPAPVLITSLPHPVRAIRRSARRGRRYLQILRIAIRHGLGPYLGLRRGTDRPADPARQARLALDEAGGMWPAHCRNGASDQ